MWDQPQLVLSVLISRNPLRLNGESISIRTLRLTAYFLGGCTQVLSAVPFSWQKCSWWNKKSDTVELSESLKAFRDQLSNSTGHAFCITYQLCFRGSVFFTRATKKQQQTNRWRYHWFSPNIDNLSLIDFDDPFLIKT